MNQDTQIGPMRARCYRIKRFIAAALCHELVGRIIARIVANNIRSGKALIDTSSPAISPSIKASIFWGFYESAEIRFIDSELRTDLDVVELGSSVGVTASHIAARLDNERQIVCVEGNPALIPVIKRNARRNWDGRVSVVHAAITPSLNGAQLQFAVRPNTTESGLMSEGPVQIDVPTSSLSRICAQFAVSDYVLVSDIEGAEVAFIYGDDGALNRCQQIIIELHDSCLTTERLNIADLSRRLIQTHGFRLRKQYGPVFVFDKHAKS